MSHPVECPELPSERSLDRMVSLLAPLQRICQPKVYGLENLPADGSLLVGNHTIYGFLDLPFMMAEVWRRRRLVIRGLGEHAHYAVPVWRDLLAACGCSMASRAKPMRSLHSSWYCWPRRLFTSRAPPMLDVIVDRNTPIYGQLGIQSMRDERDQDPHRSLLSRLRGRDE